MSSKKAFLKLFAGNLGVQVLSFLFYPILSRLYSPADFGLFGIFTSLVLILGIFCTSQIHLKFPNASDEAEALDLIYTVGAYNLLSLIGVLLVILVFQDFFFSLVGKYTYFLPVSILLFTINEVSKMWFIKEQEYGKSSLFINLNRLSSNLLKTILPSVGLIYSEAIANFVSLIYFLRVFKHSLFSRLSLFSIRVFSQKLLENWKYPTIFALGTLSQYLIWDYPILALGKVFGKGLIGQLVMANKLTIQTFVLGSSALSLVFQNRLILDIKEKKNFLPYYFKFLTLASFASVPLIVFLKLAAVPIFSFILGEQWALAGKISSILAPLILTKVAMGAAIGYLMAQQQVRFLSVIRILQFLVIYLFITKATSTSFLNIIEKLVWLDFTSELVIVFYGILKAVSLAKKQSCQIPFV